MKTSLKILMIHQHYFPEMAGTARRTKELAESFVKRGHKVHVITSFPREFRSIPDEKYLPSEILNGVSINRVKTYFEVKNNVFLRMLSYLSFVFISLFRGLKHSKNIDIIISIAPISSGITGALINSINNKRHHFDIPDILPDLGISAGMINNKWLIYLLYKLEKWVYNHSDTISTCTKGQLSNILDKKISKNKLFHIPDWVDISFFKYNMKLYKKECYDTYKFPEKKIVSFFGNIGALQNPMVFIEVMRLLNKDGCDDILFLFFGDGILLPRLKRIVKKYNLTNVKFIGRVKKEHIPSCMRLSDILITNYVSNDHLDLYIPGKLFEYAISERPILIGSRGDAKDMVEKYSLGIAVSPSNVQEFKNGILNIIDGTYSYSPKTETFIKNYSLDHVVTLYDDVLYNNIIR